MAKANLTDKAVRAAKAPAGERLEIWDSGCKGLCLRASDQGKAFYFRYRAPSGKQPRVKLGDFTDEFGLAEARIKSNRLRVAVADGGDPAKEAREAKAKAKVEAADTFNDLADQFLKASETGKWKPRRKHKRDSTISGERGVLDRHIRKDLGQLAPSQIDRRRIRTLLEKMHDAGIGAQTVRAHAVLRQIFAYAVAEEKAGVVNNPVVGLQCPATIEARSRVLTDDELKALWAALNDPSDLRQPPDNDGNPGDKVTVGRPARIALQLVLLLLQRRGEVAGMRLDELDLDRGLWLITGDRMKSGRPHLVPLPPLAVTLIREALELAKFGREDEPPTVFPARGNPAKSIRADSLTHALTELYGALEIEGAILHDLRRTGSTALTSESLGISHFVRSQVLSHTTDSGGGAVVSSAHYDQNSYLPEKRRALEAWEGLLLEIAAGQARPSNVRPMIAAGGA